MRRRTSPVQQWVDSLPSPIKSTASSLGSIVRQQSVSVESESASIPECTIEHVLSEKENYVRHSNMTVSTPITVPSSPAIVYPGRNISRLARDPSFQSDSSHCSSVESLLELRRADPEAVLLSLGFGGCASSPQDGGPLSRIPKRFLQPSRLKGIAINDFVKHQQETNESLDSTSLGYRGLTGSPYVAPSEIVQKIMQRLREHENHEFVDAYASYGWSTDSPCGLSQQQPQQEGRLSVLSPDNRQFLERPRSKSPDMRNKRMIIGQRSFAFGHDGDLIEISPARTQSQESDDVFEYEAKEETTQTGPTTIIHYAERESTRVSGASDCPRDENSRPIISLNELRSNPGSKNRDSTETILSTTTTTSSNNNNNNNNNNINSNHGSTLTLRASIDKNHNNDEPKRTCSCGSGGGGSSSSSSSSNSPRRASEGSSTKTSSAVDQEEGRRFSDGVMHSMKKTETETTSSTCSGASTMRKRSLMRQAKIRDVDHAEDAVLLEDGGDQDDLQSSARTKAVSPRLAPTKEIARCSHCGKVQRQRNDDEEEDEVRGVEDEDDAVNSCCYKRTSKNCWREMEKVLQKNKKLEDVVAKSRREMAEIRDMLTSVLSVRMEPGF